MGIPEVVILIAMLVMIAIFIGAASYYSGKASGIASTNAHFKPLMEQQNDLLKTLNQENEDLLAKLEKYGKSQCQREPVKWSAIPADTIEFGEVRE